MKSTLVIHFLLLSLLWAPAFALANKGDSTLAKYRQDTVYQQGSFYWEQWQPYYLAEKISNSTGQLNPPIDIVRQAGSGWDIIRFNKAINQTELKLHYNTVVPANNNWKFSGKMQEIITQGLWTGPLPVRAGYIGNLKTSFSSLYAISHLYPDYKCADIWVGDITTLRVLAADPCITSLSLVPAVPHPEQAVKLFDLGTNYLNIVPGYLPGITGAGTTVSIKENLFDTFDIDFKNRYRVTPYAASFIDNHAGIMASMIGGSGNSYYLGKGVAWQTTLNPASYSNLMPEPLSYYLQNLIDVQNHSYGTGIENEYAADAAAYDITSWEDSTLLHIFSSGNSGEATPSAGRYAGITGQANLTGSFKMSKNSISIGGTDSFYHTANFSSRGPAYDGRIKPELVAFGIEGTSGAAAITSGLALLLQQTLMQQTGRKPAAALVKALLINGCDDIAAEGPDFTSGYGSLNGYRSLHTAGLKNYFSGSVKEGQLTSIPINVPGNAGLIKITLAWTDMPAAPLSPVALMNDLDLELVNTSTGQIIKPWILSTAENLDSLHLPAIRGTDSLNNVEMISLTEPPPGEYVIKIGAKKLFTNLQPFSVAWHTKPLNEIRVTYPSKTSACFGNTVQSIRWLSSFLNDESGILEYRYVTSNTWKLISDTLPLKQCWFQWQAPDTTATVLLRITTGSTFLTSDTFLLSKPIELKVGYYCSDSIYLYWAKQPAQHYRLYQLGDTLMQPIFVTDDTVYVSKANQLTSSFVAVAPVIENRDAVSSNTIDFTSQGSGCYISNFTADLFGDSVLLTLTTGITFNIYRVILQKEENGIFNDLFSTPPHQDPVYLFTDKKLYQGGNRYRVKMLLNNANIFYSQVETVYFTDHKLYLLFPNPVKPYQPVYILNRYFDGDLFANVYDITARLVKKFNLPSSLNKIAISGLPKGTYLVVFNNGSRKLGVQKLVVW